jgi:predicted GNAT family acetyltransferase
VLSTASLRVLDARDAVAVAAVLARDPLVNVFVGARAGAGLEPWRLGGELWGWAVGGELESLCYAGANLVPVEAGPEAVAAFAERARRQGRRCSSIVGPVDMVEPMWRLLESSWGPARAVRSRQPFMALDRPPLVIPDPAVRRVHPDELEILLPAAVAMFTEEVGVSPLGQDAAAYRARVHDLVASGRAYARVEDGRVVFKAEIGAVTRDACQVQGVWVAPEHRGEGLAAPGTAAVVALAQAEHAPAVTLYVNDFNAAALRAYRRIGFTEIATFTTVLF